MKTMTCKQLGGPCDLEFRANTFDEIAALSQQHGMEMLQKSDPDHLQAMQAMKAILTDPAAMQTWMQSRRREFEELTDS
ncbi:MAG: hypothetical protein KDK39_12120 [Leptospiraceae bacterium]|nr:hypothetical protein [Leptospiraceae bacterium]